MLLRIVEAVDPDFLIQGNTGRCARYIAGEGGDRLDKGGKLRGETINTEVPSPFAHNLIVLGEADIILIKDRKKRLLELYESVMRRIGER